jgi:metal-responsive CopG/Arc/MetJ family transcriptional regulator
MAPAPRPGGLAAGQRRRFNETSAQLTLGTDPEKVHAVSGQVFSVVHRYDGIVLSSSISDGPEGQAGARFSLMIPSARLSDALGDLSRIAEVRSRSENSLDITAPVISTRDHLRDARAEIEGLLKQLANADTDTERAAAKAQLRFQHRRVAALRSTLTGLRRRSNLSRVSVEVVTGNGIGFSTGGDGQWTIGDALHDAGRVLAVAAGVALVGLAALAPLLILALLVWAAFRAWIRASRERALG